MGRVILEKKEEVLISEEEKNKGRSKLAEQANGQCTRLARGRISRTR